MQRAAQDQDAIEELYVTEKTGSGEIRVSTKLYAAVGALLLVGVVAGCVSGLYLRQLGKELDDTINKTAIRLDLVNSMRAGAWEMVGTMRGTFVYSTLKNPEKVEQAIREWEGAQKRMAELFREMRPLLGSDQGRELLTRMETETAAYEPLARDYMRFAAQGRFDRVAAMATQMGALVNRIDGTGKEFRSQELALLNAAESRSKASQARSSLIAMLLTAILFAIGLGAIVVVRDIDRALLRIVRDLANGSRQVASAASQIASSSQSLAQGANEQAASLEETSSSGEEINSMARRNAEQTNSAIAVVNNAEVHFVAANEKLERMIGSMAGINAATGKIAKIIKVIDGIAFQTNILALNAAVEAARAGEAGMGFSVVADEVRTLAQRCTQAARDTAELIEESIGTSRDGKEKLDEVAKAIAAIAEDAGKCKALVEQVNGGSLEQVRGVEQVAKAIAEIGRVTQQAAATAEESAAAAQQLTAQSHALEDIVDRLTAMVGVEEAAA